MNTSEQFAIVELMGHRRFGARVTEVERFGGKFLRAEILVPDADPVVQLVAPSAIYAVTECTEVQARRVNTPWQVQGALPMLPDVAGTGRVIEARPSPDVTETAECSECGAIVPRDEIATDDDGGDYCRGCREGREADAGESDMRSESEASS